MEGISHLNSNVENNDTATTADLDTEISYFDFALSTFRDEEEIVRDLEDCSNNSITYDYCVENNSDTLSSSHVLQDEYENLNLFPEQCPVVLDQSSSLDLNCYCQDILSSVKTPSTFKKNVVKRSVGQSKAKKKNLDNLKTRKGVGLKRKASIKKRTVSKSKTEKLPIEAKIVSIMKNRVPSSFTNEDLLCITSERYVKYLEEVESSLTSKEKNIAKVSLKRIRNRESAERHRLDRSLFERAIKEQLQQLRDENENLKREVNLFKRECERLTKELRVNHGNKI